MSSPLPFHTANAFIGTSPFSGNQAAVVLFPTSTHPRANNDEYYQYIARDFNLSETAFLVPAATEGEYGLRWFTPTYEIDLCGHATLASASTLFDLYPHLETLRFQTRFKDELTASRRLTGIEIVLPTLSPERLLQIIDSTETEVYTASIASICESLGVQPRDVVNITEIEFAGRSLVVELTPEVDVQKLKLDYPVLLKVCGAGAIVTQIQKESGGNILKINSRVFAPGIEIDEDPVTGSAHAYLAGYYLLSSVSARLPTTCPPKEVEIHAVQCSPRGGEMVCKLDGDNLRVKIVGRVAETARGTLTEF
ncbi:trans-2,3-dihydro-3-hydroxyanthranilate isomerase, partial [Tremellales sp. Uapishka_1]